MKRFILFLGLIPSALVYAAAGSVQAPITVTSTSAATFVPSGAIRLTCSQPVYYKVGTTLGVTGATTLSSTLDVTGAATAASLGLPSSTALAGLKFGTVTLSSASPSTATATVLSGMNCVCTNQTTQANPVKCSVSTTTLTVTGPNTVTDVVSYLCFK